MQPECAGTRPQKRARDEKIRWTLEDYVEHMHEPLYENATMNMLEACFLLCDIKVRNKMNNEACNEMCRAQHQFFLPQKNIFPPSWFLLRGIMQCAHASQFEGHMCNKCSKVLPHLDRSLWKAHAKDACGSCGHARFKLLLNGVVPFKRFWDFRVEECVKDWLADAEFAQQRGKNDSGEYRDTSDNASFLGSPRGKELDLMCGKVFSQKKHASYYSIGAIIASMKILNGRFE